MLSPAYHPDDLEKRALDVHGEEKLRKKREARERREEKKKQAILDAKVAEKALSTPTSSTSTPAPTSSTPKNPDAPKKGRLTDLRKLFIREIRKCLLNSSYPPFPFPYLLSLLISPSSQL